MPELRIGGVPPPSFQRVGMNLSTAVTLQAGILDARDNFLKAGDAASAARAALIFDDFVRTMRRIGRDTAFMAERQVRTALDSSRVRPEPQTNAKRLKDYIRADPWDASPNTATGTVVIGPHDILDKAVYWRVQEYGHHFSHSPKGFFLGPGFQGQFRPSLLERRMHPIFLTKRRAEAMGMKVPRGLARRIPPPVVKGRGFLEKGSDKAIAAWLKVTEAAVTRFAQQLSQLGRPGRP